MQNAQVLADTGGCSKCVLKHCAKIDEQNYCVVEVNGSGKMVTKSTFLHNTKVTSSKMGKDKDCENNKKPNGNVVSPLQTHHHILQYPKIVINLDFVKASTILLELRADTEVAVSDSNYCDDACIKPAIVDYCKVIKLKDYRLHTPK